MDIDSPSAAYTLSTFPYSQYSRLEELLIQDEEKEGIKESNLVREKKRGKKKSSISFPLWETKGVIVM